MLHHSVENEAEQFVKGMVFNQLDGQSVQDTQPFQALAGWFRSRACSMISWMGMEMVALTRESATETKRSELASIWNTSSVSPILIRSPDLSGRLPFQSHAVQVGAVGAPAVFEDPAAVARNDLGVFTREVTILDRESCIRLRGRV